MKKIALILSLLVTKLIAYDVSLYSHPDHLSKELMGHFNVAVLVETGTYMGTAAETAASCFTKVYEEKSSTVNEDL